MTHTPGPWEQYGGMIFSPGNGTICQLSTIHREDKLIIHSPIDVGSDDWDEAMANGALIAAAPRLLAACKGDPVNGPNALDAIADILEMHGHHTKAQWCRWKAETDRAAIAAATEQQKENT